MKIIETTRTYLRNLQIEDAGFFYHLNRDPEVMKYTGDKQFDSIEAARTFLENYDQPKKFGVGRFAVIRKEDNEFLGWNGLKYDAESNDYNIGYRFFKAFWNRGYATETAIACISYGFKVLGLPRIIGRSALDNKASISVLRKAGLTYSKKFDYEGKPWVIYVITKEDFEKSQVAF